jgi:hypothetical protein
MKIDITIDVDIDGFDYLMILKERTLTERKAKEHLAKAIKSVIEAADKVADEHINLTKKTNKNEKNKF